MDVSRCIELLKDLIPEAYAAMNALGGNPKIAALICAAELTVESWEEQEGGVTSAKRAEAEGTAQGVG